MTASTSGKICRLDELKERAALYRSLVESVQEYAIYFVDPAGNVQSWNSGAQRIKQYTAEEILGKSFALFYPPEDVAAGKPQRALEGAAANGKYEEEGWRVRKDGTHFWASVVVTPIYEAGVLSGFAKVTRDLTSRQTEQRLRQLSERLNAVLEGVADGITLVDDSGRLLFANERAAGLYGFSDAGALLAATPDELQARFSVRNEDGQVVPPAETPGQRTAVSGRPEERLLEVRDKRSGAGRWALIRAAPILGPDGKPDAAVTISHDVTALRRREETLRFLKEAGEVLSSSLDPDVTLRQLAHLVVPQLADWCTVQVLEDQELRTVVVTHTDPTKTELAHRLQERYPPRRNPSRGVYHVLATGKSELYPELSEKLLQASAVDAEHSRILRELGLRSAMIAPLAARGRVLGVISFISDESGRRYDESDQLLAEDLGRQAGLAVDNARLYKEARDAIHVRDEFLSIAGHELKTPLSALELQIQGLERAVRRGTLADSTRLAERLAKASGHGQRLARLVDELLDVSRIGAGRLQIERAPTDLGAIVREVTDRFSEQLEQNACRLSLSMSEGLVGNWDHARLDQVVSNLLSNAVKYGQGKPIDVVVERDGGMARLSVRDRGIGIDPADQARIFGRFERAVSERHYGGIGLGLWIVRQIVDAHGGAIRLESVPGRGSTFLVELPLD